MLMAATCITYRTPKNTTIQAAKTPKHYLVATKVPMTGNVHYAKVTPKTPKQSQQSTETSTGKANVLSVNVRTPKHQIADGNNMHYTEDSKNTSSKHQNTSSIGNMLYTKGHHNTKTLAANTKQHKQVKSPHLIL